MSEIFGTFIPLCPKLSIVAPALHRISGPFSSINFILLFILRSCFSARNRFHSRLLVELQDELCLMRHSVLSHQPFPIPSL